MSVNGAAFYDVKVTSSSGALGSGVNVAVSISNPSFTSASVIEYWDGSSWVSVATTFSAPDTVSANIPASALTGAPLAVGVPESGGNGLTSGGVSLLAVVAVTAVVAVAVVLGLLVYMRRRKLQVIVVK